jgi:hypothetical protein
MVATDLYRHEENILREPDVWKSARAEREHFNEVRRGPFSSREYGRTRTLDINCISETASSPLSIGIKGTKDRSHLLVLSIGFLLAGILSATMLISGLAVENGFPLSYLAATIVLIGAGIAFASEWRSRRTVQ